jgi:neutral ceramidase
MRLGVDVVAITPTNPVDMGGYAAREGPSIGVHDPLTARTLVVEIDGCRLALVAADLIGFPREQARRVRERAAVLGGLSPANVMLAATHTHSGPLPFDAPGLGGKADRPYATWLEEELARSVERAAGRLKPVCFGWASAAVEGVGAIRRAVTPPENEDPAAVLDAGKVTVIAFSDPDGPLQAVLMHYACHPTVLGPQNRLISADLFGAARSALAQRMGGGVPVVAVNGACGDVSTRFTRRAQSFAEVERLGERLAASAYDALQRVKCWSLFPETCLVASDVVTLPTRALPSMAEAVEALQQTAATWQALQMATDNGAPVDHGQLRLARTALEGAQVQVELVRAGGGALLEEQAELTAWLLGNCGLVSVPGELFSSLGEAVAAGSGLDACLVVGYANGLIGYIPDLAAFGAGGYEVLSTHLAPQAGSVLVERAVRMLQELARQSAGQERGAVDDHAG